LRNNITATVVGLRSATNATALVTALQDEAATGIGSPDIAQTSITGIKTAFRHFCLASPRWWFESSTRRLK
jgi:hypothetical protein